MSLIEPGIDKNLAHKTTSSRKAWHFVPDVPLRQAPYFETPFSLKDSALYLLNIWRPFNQCFLLLTEEFNGITT
jgi:hypothetical protein